MDVALSDLLTCPRCGPTYGLILMPVEAADRRVRTGVLGCANCRERYRVEGGVADLRVERVAEPGSASGPAVELEAADRDAAVRLAALLGLGEGGGTVLLAGPAAGQASSLAELVPEVRLVVLERGAGGAFASVLDVGGALPLRSGSLRGVALTGGRVSLLAEGARLLAAGGRLVLEPSPEGAQRRLEAAGLKVLLAEGGVVVAGRGR